MGWTNNLPRDCPGTIILDLVEDRVVLVVFETHHCAVSGRRYNYGLLVDPRGSLRCNSDCHQSTLPTVRDRVIYLLSYWYLLSDGPQFCVEYCDVYARDEYNYGFEYKLLLPTIL